MAEFTTQNAAKKAAAITKRHEEDRNRKRELIFKNAGTIISILAIGLSIVLYSYNSGYCEVYNLPVSCMPLDLKSFLPITIQVIGVIMWIISYLTLKQQDNLLGKNKINPNRILYGSLIMITIMSYNHLDKYFGRWLAVIIPIGISFTVECFAFYRHKPKKAKIIDKATFNVKTEDYVYDRLFFFNYIHSHVCVFVLAVILAGFLGTLSAKAKIDYQVIEEGKKYAIIIEYSDKVLVQEALIENNEITIYTNSYMYIDKKDHKISYCSFDIVHILEQIPSLKEQSEGLQGQQKTEEQDSMSDSDDDYSLYKTSLLDNDQITDNEKGE